MTADHGSFAVTGHSVSMTHTRPGLSSTADADDQGKIKQVVYGPAPKNEEDTRDICERLVLALNNAGGSWSDLEKGIQDIDWYSLNDSGDKVQMQVVRASNNNQLWRELNEAGSATIEYDANEVAKELMEVIFKKSKKYPAKQKRAMSLVIDSARTPSHTFQRVFDVFRMHHLEACQRAGFAQVWVVGPQTGIVERLDK